MKRLVSAGILLTLVLVSYLFSLHYITKSCDEAKNLVYACEKEYADGDAQTAATALRDYWDGKEKLLSFFVNHNHIDDIELELAALTLYSKTDREILFYEHIETLKILLHQIEEETRPNTHSIF